MSKHTPGPWIWLEDCEHSFLVSKAEYDTNPNAEAIIDDGSAWGEYRAVIEKDSANARLIAAAPDLLDALERLLADYQKLSDSGDAGFLCIEGHPVGKAAYAAIARATGEQL